MAQTEAVKPVISGPSQAEGIARFALRAKYDDLSAERRDRLKVSILDAVACAINAIGAPPIEACRAQAEELGGPDGRCTLIGGGRANPVYAAFYNTALIRYVDFMDSDLARGGLCHPSDNTGAILAASEQAGSFRQGLPDRIGGGLSGRSATHRIGAAHGTRVRLDDAALVFARCRSVQGARSRRGKDRVGHRHLWRLHSAARCADDADLAMEGALVFSAWHWVVFTG